MMFIRILLLPFTFIYGFIIGIRNKLYQSGILTRTEFDFPIVCVGNIAAGGTGKTPHIEWLIESLQKDYQIAVLSRGYKRKTSGYLLATQDATPITIGDEPFQLYQKFPNINLAVSENRVLGVPALLGDKPDTQLILMDDGFQHLPIKPGYSIILTEYQNPFYDDWLLPSGRLREFRSAYKRAQTIIVTKCPQSITEEQKQAFINHIAPLPHQLVVFSFINYGSLKPVYGNLAVPESNFQVLAFSGIANSSLFNAELTKRYTQVEILSFADHQDYSEKNLLAIVNRFEQMNTSKAIIITTEKDAVKLKTELAQQILGHLPVYFLPIKVEFNSFESQLLLGIIQTYTNQVLASINEQG